LACNRCHDERNRRGHRRKTRKGRLHACKFLRNKYRALTRSVALEVWNVSFETSTWINKKHSTGCEVFFEKN
jgi:hypothetical protein